MTFEKLAAMYSTDKLKTLLPIYAVTDVYKYTVTTNELNRRGCDAERSTDGKACQCGSKRS